MQLKRLHFFVKFDRLTAVFLMKKFLHLPLLPIMPRTHLRHTSDSTPTILSPQQLFIPLCRNLERAITHPAPIRSVLGRTINQCRVWPAWFLFDRQR